MEIEYATRGSVAFLAFIVAAIMVCVAVFVTEVRNKIEGLDKRVQQLERSQNKFGEASR